MEDAANHFSPEELALLGLNPTDKVEPLGTFGPSDSYKLRRLFRALAMVAHFECARRELDNDASNDHVTRGLRLIGHVVNSEPDDGPRYIDDLAKNY